MINYLQKKYALSKDGAKDIFKAIIWTVVLELVIIIPVILSFYFIREQLGLLGLAAVDGSKGIGFYIVLSVASFILMYIIALFHYNSVFTKIYSESARRRISLAETLRKLPLSFFGKKDVADLSSTIMEDVSEFEKLFSHSVPQLYAAGITISIMIVGLFFYNWKISIAVFWVIPVSFLVFNLSRRYQKNVRMRIYNIKRDVSDKIQEGLDSVHEIKSFNMEDSYSKKLDSKLDEYENELIGSELFIGALVNLSYIFLQLGLPTVIITGIYLLSNGSIDIFTYVVFLVLTARIYNPIMSVLNNFAALIHLNVRIDRMKEMDNMPKQEGSLDFSPDGFDIEFKRVYFSYEEGVQTLSDVSFTAKQGEVTALVGPSGGGKSTVAKLSARFWDINQGVITLGGEDISRIDPETLLNNFSIVFQDVTLFNSSVMDNIRLGKKDASDDEVIKAARLARCEGFINKLPEGYNTRIGENGEKLSGGERQRISIARAILKDAPIILLDEATASLDAENETKIQGALGELIKEKTVLIIAHRMRTVLGADKLVVLKDGSIAEMGSPEELQKLGGLFSSMLRAQYQAG